MRLLYMAFPKRNRRAIDATIDTQMEKVREEYIEMREAFVTMDGSDASRVHLAEEVLDLMLACEAVFWKLGAGDDHDRTCEAAIKRVTDKGFERGDWV